MIVLDCKISLLKYVWILLFNFILFMQVRGLLDLHFLTDFVNGFGKNVSARRNLLHELLSLGNKVSKNILQMSYAIRSIL